MSSTVVVAGLALAGLGYIGRYVLRKAPAMEQAFKTLPNFVDVAGSKYYKGGFEPKMSRREASLILGVSPSASKIRIKDAHKRIMLINHPDRGGSPYLASKINEAKDLMENSSKGQSARG